MTPPPGRGPSPAPAPEPRPTAPEPPPGRVRPAAAVAALALLWLLTRVVMLWLLTHDHLPWLGAGGVTHEPERLYTRWRETLDDGSYPSGDPLWQYPPGAGAALLLPGLLLPRLPYPWAFTALTLVADAAVTAALLRAGVTRRTRGGGRRSLLGALLWTAGLPLLLHVPLARFDVQVTALAVLALLVVDRLPRLGGALAALGALAKAWPALVLAGTEPGRTTRRAWASAALTAVTLLALLTSLFADALSFVRQQSGRGVQIESLGGTLLSFASRAGWPGQVRYQYGAMELVGPGVRVVAAASLALTAASFALIVLWRLRVVRATRAGSPHGHRYPALTHDAPLAAVLLLTVTSRVISPQYMIWLLGLSAVCLTPVSYTHLDVYKRQLLDPAALRPTSGGAARGGGDGGQRAGLSGPLRGGRRPHLDRLPGDGRPQRPAGGRRRPVLRPAGAPHPGTGRRTGRTERPGRPRRPGAGDDAPRPAARLRKPPTPGLRTAHAGPENRPRRASPYRPAPLRGAVRTGKIAPPVLYTYGS